MLTGEFIVFAGDLEAHAAGAAAVQAAQLERGACVSDGVMGRKNHGGPSAPAWDHLQKPHTAQQVHLQRTSKGRNIPNVWRSAVWGNKKKILLFISFFIFAPGSTSRHHLPVSGDGLLRVLYWLWTYGVLWWELKADEEARSSSSLMMKALGWSSGSSCSLCSRAHLSRSSRWDDSLSPHWAWGACYNVLTLFVSLWIYIHIITCITKCVISIVTLLLLLLF